LCTVRTDFWPCPVCRRPFWVTAAQVTIASKHGRWFGLTAAQFDAIHYGGMSAYKIGILLLNLVPYIALRIALHQPS
jgi:hypothetical protein